MAGLSGGDWNGFLAFRLFDTTLRGRDLREFDMRKEASELMSDEIVPFKNLGQIFGRRH